MIIKKEFKFEVNEARKFEKNGAEYFVPCRVKGAEDLLIEFLNKNSIRKNQIVHIELFENVLLRKPDVEFHDKIHVFDAEKIVVRCEDPNAYECLFVSPFVGTKELRKIEDASYYKRCILIYEE